MDPLVLEMIATLRAARVAVRQEIEARAQGRAIDREPLLRTLRAVDSFSGQAIALYQMMFERGADPALVDEAESLCDFFGEAEERIEVLLGVGRA